LTLNFTLQEHQEKIKRKNDIFLGKTPPFGSVPFFEMILLNIRMAFLVFRISALQVKKPRPRCPILANWYD
jgi:hypothetical protein